MIAQVIYYGHSIAEVSCPTRYFAEASSINLRRSIKYGFGCLATALAFRLSRMGLIRSRLFPPIDGPPVTPAPQTASASTAEHR